MRKLSSAFAIAGVLALVPAVFLMAKWYTYLFEYGPAGVPVVKAAREQLVFSFSAASPDAPWMFVVFAAMPVLCLVLACSYLVGFASSARRVHILLAFTAVAIAGAVALSNWVMAAMLAISAYYAWRGKVAPNPSFKRTPDGAA